MPFFAFLSRPSAASSRSRERRKRSFRVETLEGRELQSTVSPAVLRQDVVNAALTLNTLSTEAREGKIAGYGNAVTRSGQVNYVGTNGQIIESNGSCFDFVAETLVVAGARQATNPGPNNFYIWGTAVTQIGVADSNPRDTSHPLPVSDFAAFQPGEVIQFGNVQLSDGSFEAVQHSAVIVSVGQTNGVNNGKITVLQQNANNQHFVTSLTIDLTKMTEGRIAVYQPTSA